MSSDELLASLRAAVAVSPDDVALRVHLAQLLWAADRRPEAVQEAAMVLQRDPGRAEAMQLIAMAASVPVQEPSEKDVLASLEAELSDVLPPSFLAPMPEPEEVPPARIGAFDAEQVTLRLADVGGMSDVKARLEAAVLAPLRNPELGRLYAKSLRGGLLLYGPPGCGKTFVARALAGEMGASFIAVSLADVLDMWVGSSERNIRELFETARDSAPSVVFLDEVDALGHKRSQMRNSAARGSVNQLLSEMDGIGSTNDGVFVLGATNHPWDVDVALRRPGRFDRMVLVLPPDAPAREAILRHHLSDRPVARIDLRSLTKRTEGFSGADLAHVCDGAAERALLDSAATGIVRMIEMSDLDAALNDVRPSIGPWLDTARNVAQFANSDGTYDDLLVYLKRRRML